MTLIAVRSTTGSDSNGGTNWSDAKATLEGARLIASPGDVIFVSQSHLQNFGASNYEFVSPGTPANPVWIIGVDDSAWPPTAYHSTKPRFTATTGSIIFTGNVERQNLLVEIGSGASTNTLTASQFTSGNGIGASRGRNCVLRNLSTAGRPISFGTSNGYGGVAMEIGTEFHLGGAAGGNQAIGLNKGRVELIDCKTSSTMNTPAYLFSVGNNQYGHIDFVSTRFDCSSLASSACLLRAGLNINVLAVFRYPILPSGWTENLFNSGTLSPGTAAEIHYGKVGSSVIRYLKWDNPGVIRDNSVNVRSGGANDGAAYSMKHVTNANASLVNTLFGKELPAVWIGSTGSPLTATVEVLIDSATALTDADIWLEGGIRCSTSSEVSGRKPNLSSATTLASSAETWYTTGMTNPQKRKIQVTFTPSEAGYLHLRVAVAIKSATIYVDNKVTVA